MTLVFIVHDQIKGLDLSAGTTPGQWRVQIAQTPLFTPDSSNKYIDDLVSGELIHSES